eukprot:RCo050747
MVFPIRGACPRLSVPRESAPWVAGDPPTFCSSARLCSFFCFWVYTILHVILLEPKTPEGCREEGIGGRGGRCGSESGGEPEEGLSRALFHFAGDLSVEVAVYPCSLPQPLPPSPSLSVLVLCVPPGTAVDKHARLTVLFAVSKKK